MTLPAEHFKAGDSDDGKRIDSVLAAHFSRLFSRTKIKELILKGAVTVNGERIKPNYILSAGDVVKIEYEPETEREPEAEEIPIDVIYEDKDFLVVNKAAGVVAHPACGHKRGTLVNALLHHTKNLSRVGGSSRAGIVHRLDKDTSGLMVVAKNDRAHRSLAKQFEKSAVEKKYIAVVKGVVEHDELMCEEPLARSKRDRKKMAVDMYGKTAMTRFKVLERFQNATLVEAKPKTGRTHQIRVHLHHLKHPVLGDREYGTPSILIARQALHAAEIAFSHPATGKTVRFEAPPPADIRLLLKQLRSDS